MGLYSSQLFEAINIFTLAMAILNFHFNKKNT